MRRGRVKWERANIINLRILQQNADGIGNNGAELEECMIKMNVNVAVIQESKLGGNRKINEGMRVAIDVSRNERIIITNVYRPPVRRI